MTALSEELFPFLGSRS